MSQMALECTILRVIFKTFLGLAPSGLRPSSPHKRADVPHIKDLADPSTNLCISHSDSIPVQWVLSVCLESRCANYLVEVVDWLLMA